MRRPNAWAWAETPRPGPNGCSRSSRDGVVTTVLAAPVRKLRAAASAWRGPKPIGISTAMTSASVSSSKFASTGWTRWSPAKRPSSRTTATQPPLVPSTPATRTGTRCLTARPFEITPDLLVRARSQRAVRAEVGELAVGEKLLDRLSGGQLAVGPLGQLVRVARDELRCDRPCRARAASRALRLDLDLVVANLAAPDLEVDSVEGELREHGAGDLARVGHVSQQANRLPSLDEGHSQGSFEDGVRVGTIRVGRAGGRTSAAGSSADLLDGFPRERPLQLEPVLGMRARASPRPLQPDQRLPVECPQA